MIRIATSKDLPVLLDFEQGVIRAERPFDPTIKADPVLYYDLNELLSSNKALVVVAEEKGKVIACGYAKYKKARPYLDHSDYAYLGFMFTHPEYRGKGINAKILDVLKNWSTEQGLTEIRLSVYEENLPAMRAYEKYGFKKHLVEMRLPRAKD